MPVDRLFNTTIDLLSKNIDLRARNQNHLSANIANAETPDYTPRRLSFESELKDALQEKKKGGAQLAPNPRHIPIKGGSSRIDAVQGQVVETPSTTSGRDGNRVELETEMAQLAENQIMYNAGIQILAKKFEGLKTAIKGQ